MTPRRTLSVFLVSLAAIAFEVMLTRYFAIASWAEYGYWVISMAMVGYAFSGVLLSLFRSAALKHSGILFPVLPLLLMVAAAGGFHFTTTNPFNPLELQNSVLWTSQLWNIGAFYLALFPYFFLSGFFLGLSFLVFQAEISALYAADLIGAGCGAVVILALMFVVHPFYLVCAIPLFLALAAILSAPPKSAVGRRIAWALTVLLLAGCETWVIFNNHARFFEFKAIYPVLHVADNRVLGEVRSPRGYYLILDNFTERRDLPVSNNTGLMGLANPPAAPGIYKDGNRITSIAGREDYDMSYVDGALSTLPYRLRPASGALLAGASGGFRLLEAKHLQCGRITVLEPDGTVYDLIRQEAGDARSDDVHLFHESPQSYLARTGEQFDVIDVADEYMDEGPANKYAFTREAVERYYRALKPNGILSLPISIREFTVYAVKLVETVREALASVGVSAPEDHVVVYRSEWSARILVSRSPFAADDVSKITAFCSDLSFDTSYYPGIDPEKVEVWNDLPPVSFEDETSAERSDKASDALRDDVLALLGPDRPSFLRRNFFNLRPATNDRPFLQYIFRPSKLGDLLGKMELIPHEEIGFLTNVAVLVQAALFGLAVLLLPVARIRTLRGAGFRVVKGSVYFAALGLGFLFIEITLIEKFAYLLNDAVSSFAVVLSAMLIFSGLGSAFAGRFKRNPRRGLLVAVPLVVVSLLVYMAFLDDIIVRLIDQAFLVKCAVILALIAPVSFALGMPFPLGMGTLTGPMLPFLPMAWAINGAFSVVSSPLANVLAVLYGYGVVFLVAIIVYPLAFMAFPADREGLEDGSPAS